MEASQAIQSSEETIEQGEGAMTPGATRHTQAEDPESETATRKVVVGIDGSPASLEALEFAAQEATLRGASLQVTMTWDWPLGICQDSYDPRIGPG